MMEQAYGMQTRASVSYQGPHLIISTAPAGSSVTFRCAIPQLQQKPIELPSIQVLNAEVELGKTAK